SNPRPDRQPDSPLARARDRQCQRPNDHTSFVNTPPPSLPPRIQSLSSKTTHAERKRGLHSASGPQIQRSPSRVHHTSWFAEKRVPPNSHRRSSNAATALP